MHGIEGEGHAGIRPRRFRDRRRVRRHAHTRRCIIVSDRDCGAARSCDRITVKRRADKIDRERLGRFRDRIVEDGNLDRCAGLARQDRRRRIRRAGEIRPGDGGAVHRRIGHGHIARLHSVEGEGYAGIANGLRHGSRSRRHAHAWQHRSCNREPEIVDQRTKPVAALRLDFADSEPVETTCADKIGDGECAPISARRGRRNHLTVPEDLDPRCRVGIIGPASQIEAQRVRLPRNRLDVLIETVERSVEIDLGEVHAVGGSRAAMGLPQLKSTARQRRPSGHRHIVGGPGRDRRRLERSVCQQIRCPLGIIVEQINRRPAKRRELRRSRDRTIETYLEGLDALARRIVDQRNRDRDTGLARRNDDGGIAQAGKVRSRRGGAVGRRIGDSGCDRLHGAERERRLHIACRFGDIGGR